MLNFNKLFINFKKIPCIQLFFMFEFFGFHHTILFMGDFSAFTWSLADNYRKITNY